MTAPLVIFSHGQESGPWGTKIQAMARAVEAIGWRAESIDYRGIVDPVARVKRLVAECEKLTGPRVLVGSSMGGHVATAAAGQVDALGLFVLAPAYYIEEWQVATPAAPDIPIVIVHGWRDEVVPVENSIRYARACRATLHLVDSDHRLTDHIDAISDYLQQFLAKLRDPLT